jgi:hypothetical protein
LAEANPYRRGIGGQRLSGQRREDLFAVLDDQLAQQAASIEENGESGGGSDHRLFLPWIWLMFSKCSHHVKYIRSGHVLFGDVGAEALEKQRLIG